MEKKKYTRQSFLGKTAQERFLNTKVAVVGLGGGGSHVAQQLGYVGFAQYALYDPDRYKDVNANRTVGAFESDIDRKTPKVEIAKRMIKKINGPAKVETFRCRWQDKPFSLRSADIIFGCVDGFSQRRELEATARRYLIPYIDIGMDVHPGEEGFPPRMCGQVILSMPGHPCMTCMGFLNATNLAREASQYGVAGDHPQVIWTNGILALLAVSIAVDLLTDWTKSLRKEIYTYYNDNSRTLIPSVKLDYLPSSTCPHFPLAEVGDPVFM
jgi:hypothetical protein